MKLFSYALLFVGTVGIALFGIVKRWTLSGKPVSPLLFLVASNAVMTVLFGVIYISVWGLGLPSGILSGFWRAALITGALNVFIQFLTTRASSMPAGEVSLTAPLQAMTPGLITVVAISLGELPGKIGVAGVALMTLGSYVLLLELKPSGASRWYDYLKPFRVLGTIFKWSGLSESERDKAKVVIMSLGSACFGALALLFDGLYARRGVNLAGLTIGSMTVTGFLTVVYCIWFIASRDDRNPKWRGQPHFSSGLVWGSIMVGVLWVTTVFTVNPVYMVSYVAYVGTLKRFSIIMSGVLAWLLFNDQNIKRRLAAAGLVTAGAILLASDDLPTRISTKIVGWGL